MRIMHFSAINVGKSLIKIQLKKNEKICPNCNAKNEHDNDFCDNCGSPFNGNNNNAGYESPISFKSEGTKFDLKTLLVTSVVVALTYIVLEVISSNVSNSYIVLRNLLYLYCLVAGLLGGFLFNKLNTLEHNYINNILFSVFGLIIIMLYYGLTGGEVGNLATQITNLVLIIIGSLIGSYLELNALY